MRRALVYFLCAIFLISILPLSAVADDLDMQPVGTISDDSSPMETIEQANADNAENESEMPTENATTNAPENAPETNDSDEGAIGEPLQESEQIQEPTDDKGEDVNPEPSGADELDANNENSDVPSTQESTLDNDGTEAPLPSEEQEIAADEEPEEESAPEEKTAISYSELIVSYGESDELLIEGDVLIEEDTTLEDGKTLHIISGVVNLAEGKYFENKGRILISGGELVISSTAELANLGYIEVCEEGKLIVAEDAIFEADEGSVLLLNTGMADAVAEVLGVPAERIERMVFAGSADALLQMLAQDGYAFTTVCIEDINIMIELGSVSLGTSQAISFVG